MDIDVTFKGGLAQPFASNRLRGGPPLSLPVLERQGGGVRPRQRGTQAPLDSAVSFRSRKLTALLGMTPCGTTGGVENCQSTTRRQGQSCAPW